MARESRSTGNQFVGGCCGTTGADVGTQPVEQFHGFEGISAIGGVLALKLALKS